jgi:hypothetical protein
MTLEECKMAIKACIDAELAKGTRKANIEIELIHFIKGELYKED